MKGVIKKESTGEYIADVQVKDFGVFGPKYSIIVTHKREAARRFYYGPWARKLASSLSTKFKHKFTLIEENE